jgi:hypothetical protein
MALIDIFIDFFLLMVKDYMIKNGGWESSVEMGSKS